MKILSLNCQKGYQPGLKDFLQSTFTEGEYDFILLQEFTPEMVVPLHRAGSYELIQALNEVTGKPSPLAIAHRKSIPALAQRFTSYAGMRHDPILGFAHPNFGLLQARFTHEGKPIVMGSLHLHTGMQPSARIAEIQRTKKEMREFMQEDDKAVFGGDCNTGFPGEAGRLARAAAPEFIQVTRNLGGTLDSRYTEYNPNLMNRAATALAKIGLGIKLKADHIFIDQTTAANYNATCRILPERVSDHNPIELLLSETAK